MTNINLQKHFVRIAERKKCLRALLEKSLKTQYVYHVLEIGCGHGDFLVPFAQQSPEKYCVGVDLNGHRIETAQKKAKRVNLANTLFIKAEIEEFLDCLPENFLWDEILVFYPDPWPKRKHHKNRLFQDSFLNFLAAYTHKNTQLHFETDSQDYFISTYHCFESNPFWTPLPYSQNKYTVNTFFSQATGSEAHHAIFKRI